MVMAKGRLTDDSDEWRGCFVSFHDFLGVFFAGQH